MTPWHNQNFDYSTPNRLLGRNPFLNHNPYLMNNYKTYNSIEYFIDRKIHKIIEKQLNSPKLFGFQEDLLRSINEAVKVAAAQEALTRTEPPAKVATTKPEPSPQPKETPMTSFVLKPNASRRTRQRWAAHERGDCALNCRFCRKLSAPTYENISAPAETASGSVPERIIMEPQPVSAETVLADVVSDHHEAAAKQVARSKAAAEIHQVALIPGMKVYHQFSHEPCILLEQTAPGRWTIQTKSGNQEEDVKAAILTPVAPALPIRAWMALQAAATAIAYKETEIPTPQGLVTVQQSRVKLMGQALLQAVSAIFVACLYVKTKEKTAQGREITVYKRGKVKHLFWATMTAVVVTLMTLNALQ